MMSSLVKNDIPTMSTQGYEEQLLTWLDSFYHPSSQRSLQLLREQPFAQLFRIHNILQNTLPQSKDFPPDMSPALCVCDSFCSLLVSETLTESRDPWQAATDHGFVDIDNNSFPASLIN